MGPSGPGCWEHWSDTLLPSLKPHINSVTSKPHKDALLRFREGISRHDIIDEMSSYISTCQANMGANLDIQIAGPHVWEIFLEMIYWVNSATFTTQQHGNPDALLVKMAKHTGKWHRHGNPFNNNLIQGDCALCNDSLVCQWAHCTANPLYAFQFSDRINSGDANANRSVLLWTVLYDI